MAAAAGSESYLAPAKSHLWKIAARLKMKAISKAHGNGSMKTA